MAIHCSIIIVSFNTCELTLRCVRTIHCHPPTHTYEIIVVDNNSSDGTVENISRSFPETIVLKHPANLGFAKACNAGAKIAQGRYLCFLNSDAEATGEAIDLLIEWLLDHPNTGIVGPELRTTSGNLIQASWGLNPLFLGEIIQQFFAPYSLAESRSKRRLVKWLQRKPRRVPTICGACLMIRRETFEQLHGFDSEFELYFEDSDLCLRCRHLGWHIDFLSVAKVIHHMGQSTKGSWGLTPLMYRQSQIHYYRKHAPNGIILLLKLYLFIKWGVVWMKSKVLVKDRDRILLYLRRFMDVILEKRKLTLSDESA